MPIRACLVDGRPAFRWGRSGPPVLWGDDVGRSPYQAAALLHERARRSHARRLVLDEDLRGDGRRRTGWAKGRARFSDRVVTLHERMLHARLEMAERLFLDLAAPALAGIQRDLDAQREGLRGDARRRRRADGAVDVLQVMRVLHAIETTLRETSPEEGVRYIGEEVEDETVDSTDRELSRLFTVPIASAAGSDAIVEAWIRDNVGLITRLERACFSDLEQLVRAAIYNGAPTRHLRDDIAERFGVHKNYANFLARDQTAKICGRITQAQHERYGIEEYQWSTSGDSRVRQEHVDLDGTIHRWTEPPIADRRGKRGHPGEVWQCRCTALAIFDEEDRALMIAQAEARKERELRLLQASPIVKGEIPNRSGFSDWNRARIERIRRGARSSVGL